MSLLAFVILSTFTSPENIDTNPLSMLWLLPLAASIAVVYKATKLTTIKVGTYRYFHNHKCCMFICSGVADYGMINKVFSFCQVCFNRRGQANDLQQHLTRRGR
jgi:hypothetical protein